MSLRRNAREAFGLRQLAEEQEIQEKLEAAAEKHKRRTAPASRAPAKKA